MKRLIILVLAVILLLGLSATAYADVLWIPDNLFLNQHMEDCQRSDRSYRALTEVKVYQSPEDDKVLWMAPAGYHCFIYYTYEDANGNLWGLTENRSVDFQAGWVPLAYMELVYDYISFEEDYGHLFEYVDEPIYLDEAYAGQEIYYWDYPGSDSWYSYQAEADYMPSFNCFYTDDQGLRWGYVNYHMGLRNVWFCISNPTAELTNLVPEGVPEVRVTEPGETEPTLPTEEIVPQISRKTKEVYTIIAIGVIGCVVISGALLLRAKKKSK